MNTATAWLNQHKLLVRDRPTQVVTSDTEKVQAELADDGTIFMRKWVKSSKRETGWQFSAAIRMDVKLAAILFPEVSGWLE